MSQVRVHNFSISLDGFGTGDDLTLDAPFGHAGERLHEWMFATRFWHDMVGEDGGSMGIDNRAVKETVAQVLKKVEDLQGDYKIPVLVEKFIDGREITGVVFEDGKTRHVFLAEKKFRIKPDGKHEYTSIESYDNPNAAKYQKVEEELEKKLAAPTVVRWTTWSRNGVRSE